MRLCITESTEFARPWDNRERLGVVDWCPNAVRSPRLLSNRLRWDSPAALSSRILSGFNDADDASH
jgi:hypothetical protein